MGSGHPLIGAGKSNLWRCRASTSPFTFIMQIMFGNPSLSLTFSWAAPGWLNNLPSSPSESGLASALPLGSPAESVEDYATIAESELLGKPFELTLARYAHFKDGAQPGNFLDCPKGLRAASILPTRGLLCLLQL